MNAVRITLQPSDWQMLLDHLDSLRDGYERTVMYYQSVGTVEEIGMVSGDVNNEEEALVAFNYCGYLIESIRQQIAIQDGQEYELRSE